MADHTPHSQDPQGSQGPQRPGAPVPPAGAPVPPAGASQSVGAPRPQGVPQPAGATRPTGAPQPPTPRDAAGTQAPRSLVETARDAVETNLPGLDDVNVRQVDAIEPGPHRASPLSFIPLAIKIVPALLVAFGAMFLGMVRDPEVTAFQSPSTAALATALVVAGTVVLTVVVGLISWYINTWELDDDALVLRKRFVVSTEKRIPYQRIHSIDLSAGLFARLLGLVNASIDTGTGTPEKIEGLKRTDAEVLKRAVFARKELLSKVSAASRASAASNQAGLVDLAGSAGASQSAGASATPAASGASAFDDVLAPDRVDHETRLTMRQYVLGALTSLNINGVILALAGFVGGLVSLVDYAADIFGDALVYGLLGAGVQATVGSTTDLAQHMGEALVPVALGILVVVLVVVWLLSAVLSLVKWGNFVVRRRGERVEVSWGLLSRSTRAVELSRVQVVTVEQSLIRRAIGHARVVVHIVSSSGEDGSSSGDGVVVHPFIRLADVDAWLAEVLPEFTGVVEAAPDLDHLPKRALRRTLLRGLYWTVGLGACVAALLYWGLPWVDAMMVADGSGPIPPLAWDIAMATGQGLVLFVLVWGEFVRVLGWRLRRVGARGTLLVTVDGALGRTVSACPRTKLQSVQASQTPFQAHARVATVTTRTACVTSAHDLSMRDASVETSDAILSWARPRYHNEEQVARALAEAGLA